MQTVKLHYSEFELINCHIFKKKSQLTAAEILLFLSGAIKE